MAVTMLQHGSYAAAIATLQDALNLLRAPPPSTSSRDRSMGEETTRALRRAQTTLWATTTSSSANKQNGDPIVKIVSSQTSPASLGESLLLQLLEKEGQVDHDSVLYAITLDVVDSCLDDEWDTDGPPDGTVESFVLLYNYGIAYTCCALYCRADDDDQVLHGNAYRILQTVAHSMCNHKHSYDQIQQYSCNSNNTHCSTRATLLVVVYLLLLRHLALASARLGLWEAHQGHQRRFHDWVAWIIMARGQEDGLPALPRAAPAA